MSDLQINLAVALPAEAKPLIRHYGLRRHQPDGACPVYLGEDMALVLTGAGTRAMERGVELLGQGFPDGGNHWVNLGIAGHGSLPLGSCLLADSVTERHSGRHWRLRVPVDIELPVGPLHCVTEAASAYAADTGYDMESGGFAAALSFLGVLDRASILKIVSDGPHQPCGQINGRMVTGLMQSALPVITALITHLRDHA